jgi:uncharacterized tellurite resistance protein B-like protein
MNEKLSLLADLVKLAKIDKEFREEEQQFIYAIATQMGVTQEGFTRVFNENIEFTPPKLEVDRILQFQRLILVMSVDGSANKEEQEFVKKLGVKMGLNPLAIHTVLSEMHNYPNNMLPAERLIEIFKSFHN